MERLEQPVEEGNKKTIEIVEAGRYNSQGPGPFSEKRPSGEQRQADQSITSPLCQKRQTADS